VTRERERARWGGGDLFGYSRFEKGQRQPKKTQTRKGEKEKEGDQFGSNRW
jgi:hypothetical protein